MRKKNEREKESGFLFPKVSTVRDLEARCKRWMTLGEKGG